MQAVGRTRISTTTWTPSPSRRSSTPASTARRSTLKGLLALISLGFYVDHRFPQVRLASHPSHPSHLISRRGFWPWRLGPLGRRDEGEREEVRWREEKQSGADREASEVQR
ncbi:hypothetical protein ZWY2020_011783 [Hordeum vulgare]|nr:hypothetical protein ZWY2020_011783 [Hordeum vulgare]